MVTDDSADGVQQDVQQSALDPAARRADGMPRGKPFQRGQSGNLRGRPKGVKATAQRACGGEDGKKMIAMLAGIAFDPLATHRQKMEAAEILLAYAYGKPQTSVSLEGNEMRPLIIDNVTTADVRVVHFGGRYKPDGALQDEPVETRPVPRSVDRRTTRDDDRDDDTDILTAAAQRPTGALPAPTVATPEPEPEDPAESAWTVVTAVEP